MNQNIEECENNEEDDINLKDDVLTSEQFANITESTNKEKTESEEQSINLMDIGNNNENKSNYII